VKAVKQCGVPQDQKMRYERLDRIPALYVSNKSSWDENYECATFFSMQTGPLSVRGTPSNGKRVTSTKIKCRHYTTQMKAPGVVIMNIVLFSALDCTAVQLSYFLVGGVRKVSKNNFYF